MPLHPYPRLHTFISDFEDAMVALRVAGPGMDLCEFCGGEEARTTIVSIKRRLKAGRNFDLVTNVDLGDPRQQQLALRYLDENQVLVLSS